MPTLAHLYVRTPQGRIAAFNPFTELPPQLKTLLKAVDGKTATTAIEAAHAPLGNVARMLALLQGNGLIADKHAALAPAALNKPAAPELPEPPWSPSENQFTHTGSSDFGASLASYFSASEMGHWNDETVAMMDAPAEMPHSVLDLLARQVADSMCTFVLTHLPTIANREILEIEKILTPAQLKAELPRYERLAKSQGPQGAEHFAVIQQLSEKLLMKAGI